MGNLIEKDKLKGKNLAGGFKTGEEGGKKKQK